MLCMGFIAVFRHFDKLILYSINFVSLYLTAVEVRVCWEIYLNVTTV